MILPPLTQQELNTRSINRSAAEFMVIEKLESIAKDRNWIILKSFRLENHHSKREGEIDIVIFTPTQGIILLEVKGSQLRVEDGSWSVLNRGAKKWEKIQDPFQQIHDATYAFIDETKYLFKLFQVRPLISWGCIFPETNEIRGTVSYPSWRFCNADRFEDLEPFIDKLVKKEKGKLYKLKKSAQTRLDLKLIRNIIEKLIPLSETGNFIVPEYNEALNRLDKETELVRQLMNAFSYNRFIFAEGAAGTGKTRAAIFECQRLSRESKSFIFLCRSELLAEHLQRWLEKELSNGSSKILWGTNHIGNLNIQEHDALVIDEAQDLVHLETIKNIILEFDRTEKLIRIFGDFDFQNIYGSKAELFEWFARNGLEPSKSRLSLNCRNTIQIGENIRNLADFDDSVFSLGSTQGEDVMIRNNVPCEQLASEVISCIKDWTEKNYPASGITVLGYNEETPISNENEFLEQINAIHYRDRWSTEDSSKVNFSYIMNFKGLESPCIILVVNDIDENWQKRFYTAVSRARLKVYIIFSSSVTNEKLQDILCKMI